MLSMSGFLSTMSGNVVSTRGYLSTMSGSVSTMSGLTKMGASSFCGCPYQIRFLVLAIFIFTLMCYERFFVDYERFLVVYERFCVDYERFNKNGDILLL